MDEIIFLIEESPEGDYLARAMAASFLQRQTLTKL
jgi:hypothetical protein